MWCVVTLNTTKTKELILDFTFLGTTISTDLSWSANTKAVVKKTQQCLHFLRVLRKNKINQKLMITFYRFSVEIILTYCTSLWFSHCTEVDRKNLQGLVKTAQMVVRMNKYNINTYKTNKKQLSIVLFSSQSSKILCYLHRTGWNARS